MATVTAVVQTGPRRLELRTFPRPKVGPEEGLLRVEACGICGTDVEQYDGHLVAMMGLRYPLIPGHEPVGILEEVGEVAAARWGVQPGDRVAVEAFIPCGHCRYCLSGRYTGCRGWDQYPFCYSVLPTDRAPGLWGGFAEYLYLHPNSLLHKISRTIPAETAVLFNPLAAGVRWASTIPGTRLGDTVVILGPGQRGLACVIAARAAGAGLIMVTGLRADETKLALARALGADHTLVVEEEPVVERVRALTGGEGADIVIDVSPYATQPVVDAIEMVRPEGTVVLAGLKGNRKVPDFISDRVVTKAITIKGAFGVDFPAYAEAIRIIESGKYPLHRLTTHRFGLDQVDRAIRTLGREIAGEDAIAVCIQP